MGTPVKGRLADRNKLAVALQGPSPGLEAARKDRSLVRASLCVNGPLCVMATLSVVLGLSDPCHLAGGSVIALRAVVFCLAGVESTDLVGAGQACGRRSTGGVPEVQPFPLAVPVVGEVEGEVASAVPGRAGRQSDQVAVDRRGRAVRTADVSQVAVRERQARPNWSICTQPGPMT